MATRRGRAYRLKSFMPNPEIDMAKAAKKKTTTKKKADPKKGKTVQASAPKGGPTDDARGIAKSKFDAFMKSYRAMKNDAAEASGNVGGLVSNYAENHKLHKKAFGLIKTLDRMRENPVGLAELLFHFDLMREHGGYDQIAATDMLPDRSPEANVRRKKVGKDAAAEQGKDDDEATEVEADGGTELAPDNPFRPLAEAGDKLIEDNIRRTH